MEGVTLRISERLAKDLLHSLRLRDSRLHRELSPYIIEELDKIERCKKEERR
jgi:hypothetical protein